jgi:hypothetical protein
MPPVAAAIRDLTNPAPQPTKRVRINPALRKALQLLATGECKTQRAAAARSGMSEFQLSRRLAEPQIQALIARESRKTIASAQLRASHRLVELIDANSEHVAAQVSERILTSEGILKSDQHAIAVNVDVKAGFILDLREEPHRTIEHAPSGTDVE